MVLKGKLKSRKEKINEGGKQKSEDAPKKRMITVNKIWSTLQEVIQRPGNWVQSLVSEPDWCHEYGHWIPRRRGRSN